jgi:hypothetical protein
MEYFDSKWHFVGTKVSLRHELANITRVNSQVLDESPQKNDQLPKECHGLLSEQPRALEPLPTR